jgi:hypothetical protein
MYVEEHIQARTNGREISFCMMLLEYLQYPLKVHSHIEEREGGNVRIEHETHFGLNFLIPSPSE